MSLITCCPDLMKNLAPAEHKPIACERFRSVTVLCQPSAKVNASYGRAIGFWRKITADAGEQSLTKGFVRPSQPAGEPQNEE